MHINFFQVYISVGFITWWYSATWEGYLMIKSNMY